MHDPIEQNPRLGDEIRAMVERQLHDPKLDEPNRALDRLMGRGHSREKAINTIGAVLLEEIFETMTAKELFDRERYTERLREL